jgi:DNA polymerase-3 subunit gamma/tau
MPGPPESRPVTHTPTFTRYGEAVVREVLGAKFIEEIPLSNQYDS